MSKTRSSPPGQPTTSSPAMDRTRFAALYHEAYPRLWLIAVAIVRDRVHAEDIVQEAAVVGLRKLNQFKVGTNFGAWMSEIVRLHAMNYARKRHHRKTITSDPQTIAEMTTVVARPAPSDVVSKIGGLVEHQTEFDDEVISGLSMLSEDARCCLLLRVVQQLSYKEISELLSIPEGTAMSHVHRSKATLRKHLKQHPG